MNSFKRKYFSIITVSFNAEAFIERTIQSVLSQDFASVEYIIVDGGSNDSTLELISKYKQKIDILVSESDNGIYDAMNKAMKLSSGQYVNFLNAGDTFTSDNTLTLVAQKMNSNGYKILSGDFFILDEDSNEKEYINTRLLSINNLRKDFYACHQSIFIDRKYCGPYDLNYRIKADYKWVLEAVLEAEPSEVCKMDIALINYLKDGFSNRLIYLNIKELIKLHREKFGKMQLIKNFNIYLYRILRSYKNRIIDNLK